MNSKARQSLCSEDARDVESIWPLPELVEEKDSKELHQTSVDNHGADTTSIRPKLSRGPASRGRSVSIVCLLLITVLSFILGLIFGLRHLRDNSSSKSCSQGRKASAFVHDTSTWQGVNLGNWLILERWMNPSYYAFYTGINQTDEWSFCRSLGSRCGPVLETHWNDWLAESDVQQLSGAGVNLVRVPIGFWAFMKSYSWEPYYTGSQLAQVERLLGYASKHNMSVILDLHGLPGSQNGKDHSGHAGSIQFFNSTNQQRAGAMLEGVFAFLRNTTYLSSVVALEVANEPDLSSEQNMKVYKQYLQAAHAKLASFNNEMSSEMALMFHDGFVGGQEFEDSLDACENIVIDYHQYYSSANATTEQAISAAVCTPLAYRKTNFMLFYGEWSLSFNDPTVDASFFMNLFHTQISQYASTTGSAFWNYKVYDAAGISQVNAWSLLGLIQAGVLNETGWGSNASIC